MVPCSRSRMTAAPARIIDSMVTLLMICMMAVNQLDSRFGLKRERWTSTTGEDASPDSAPGTNRTSAARMLWIYAVPFPASVMAVASTLICSVGLAPGQDVGLEFWRDIDDEGVLSAVERGVDLGARDRSCGGLK